MSQEQSRRPQGGDQAAAGIKYGDVSGELPSKNLAPRDAAAMQDGSPSPAIVAGGGITIGEALEAAAISVGDKPVDMSDAAAIQAAEVRATGRAQVMPDGIGAEAQSAATLNPQIMRDQDKTKLGDILGDATDRLADDKTVTREDAERIIAAEVSNDPNATPHPGGVAASAAAAATLNHKAQNP